MMRSSRASLRGATLCAAVIASGAIAPAAATAQSNLSTQGFGYPTGQFSARALGAGGALGEMDPLSTVNPASIAILGARTIFFQIQPEYRTVTTAAGSERTSTARYPIVFGAIPVGTNWVFSLGSSTLLDRTSSTSFRTTQFLAGGDSVPINTKFGIDGAMNDVRFAVGWMPVAWLHLGLGAHAITGRNLITVTQAFDDSTRFSTFSQQRTLGFLGSAVSGGFELVSKKVIASASGRIGGSLRLSASDTVLTKANVPDRYGASVSYIGFTNSTISVRTSHDSWSSLGSLGSAGLKGIDAWDSSIGADVAGPKFADRILFFRGGFRTRTLPFLAAGDTVKEKSFSGGLGTTFAGGHVLGDLAVIRASRSAGISASEHAWTVSIGLTVRP
ncbi:MAG: hypothetical protein ABI442_01920 [Gemmatimonadaceae bacterium]